MARLGPLVPLVPLVRLGLLLCLLPGVRGYSSGMVAPAACSNMVPSHTGSPQTGPSPFYVTSSNTTYQDGDTITVQLQSTGATPFKGFLLQAREVGGETPLGSFTVAGGAAQTLSCGLKSHNSAVSHTSSSDKNLISATWTAAASENPKDIEFRATFVESYSRFWVSVRSPILIHSGASPNITPTASVSSGSSTPSTLSISSAGCGRTKVCFSEPLNCDPAVDTGCHFMSASVSGLRTKAEAEAHFELKGRGPGYVSFAFSQDQKMGNDDIYICGLDARGLVRVQRAYSTGRQKPNTLDLGNVSRVLGSLQDGVISCSFTSTNPISTQEGQTGFDAPYYLLFAYGPSTDGEIGFHSGRFSSSEKLTISEYKQLSISSAGCGRTKVCFSEPLNCDPAVDTGCHFMSASVSGLRTKAEAEAHFELKGRGPGYVSFAFSQDQKMGNDDIYICGLDARGLVRVQRAYSTGRQEPNTLDLGNVSRVLGSLQDGVISCSFTSTNPISTQEGQTGFDAPYYLLFAYGPSTDGEIGFHSGRFSSSEKLTISEYKQLSISSAGCGRTKVCFSDPRNCDPALDTACHFMSASVSGLRTKAEAEAHFELKGRGPGYVSFGFSQDQKMGNDDIYICGLDARGLVRVQRAYSTGRQKPNTLDLGNVSRVLGSLQDGVISCSFTSTNPISTQEGQTGFDAPYYLLFAYGPSTDGEIGFHSGRFSSSEKLTISEYKQVGAAGSPQSIRAHGALMLIAWMTTASLGMMVARYLKGLAKSHSPFGKALSISSAGCGRTKVCFSDPRNCDPALDTACHFMSASVSGLRAEAEAEAHFELKGRGPGYVSFGFSQDQKMGNDDIYICGLDARGLVGVQRAYSTGRQKPNTLDLGNVSRVLGSLQDGVISCSFTSTNPISTQEGQTGFDAPYYLLFAYGPSTDGEIGFHSGRFSSSEKLTISEYKQVGAAGSPQSIRAHGALMLIAWMTTASLGMMVARYLKGLAKSHSPFGKAVWFLAHVSLMSLTVILTLIAFIVIFSYVRGWSGGAHPVLGCLVTILAIIQPLGALFRCGPDHRMRYVFNWLHMLNALVMKVLAVAAIFTGLLMFDRSEDQALVKVMGGFVGWEAAFYLSYELYSRCRQPGFDIDGPKAQTLSLSLLVVFFLGNLAFLVTLLVGISEG